MKRIVAPLLGLCLSGCAFQTQMMSRDDGKIYPGTLHGNGFGQGTMAVKLASKDCSGTAVRTASNDSFGFFQTYGKNSSSGSFQNFGGSANLKALLSCSDGTGLRCDLAGSPSGGGGICMDSNNHIYDMIVTPG